MENKCFAFGDTFQTNQTLEVPTWIPYFYALFGWLAGWPADLMWEENTASWLVSQLKRDFVLPSCVEIHFFCNDWKREEYGGGEIFQNTSYLISFTQITSILLLRHVLPGCTWGRSHGGVGPACRACCVLLPPRPSGHSGDLSHVVSSATKCDATAKLKLQIKRNGHHLNTSGALA